MVKMDILDYGIYCGGKHIADADDVNLAKNIANGVAANEEEDVVILNNFTGEIVTEFIVRTRVEIIEVEP